jgi:hypothetical protein
MITYMKHPKQFDKATEARRAARNQAAKPGATRKIENKKRVDPPVDIFDSGDFGDPDEYEYDPPVDIYDSGNFDEYDDDERISNDEEGGDLETD